MVVTVTVAFIISLFVSLSVVHVYQRIYLRIKKRADDDSFNKRVIEKGIAVYKKLLKGVLRHKMIVISGIVILFIASFLLVRYSGREFLPQIDDGKISIKVKLPVGSALEKTDAVVKKLEAVINTMPGVKKVYSMVGGYWQRRNVYEKANEADITVELAGKIQETASHRNRH
jgi:multidrug efflux pump subunit AcrB